MPRKKVSPKKPMTIETLKVQKTPDKKREYWSRTGKEYGLGVNQFIYNLFCLNEDLPRVKKMTDEEIRRQIVTEYAAYKDTREWYSKQEDAIIDARQRFNRGSMGPQKKNPPLKCSFRYNERGDAIHRGKPISPAERMDYYAHWTAIWMKAPGEFKDGIIIREWMLDPNHPSVVKWFHRVSGYSKRSKECWERARAQKANSKRNVESG